jgi:hypothetical protein
MVVVVVVVKVVVVKVVVVKVVAVTVVVVFGHPSEHETGHTKRNGKIDSCSMLQSNCGSVIKPQITLSSSRPLQFGTVVSVALVPVAVTDVCVPVVSVALVPVAVTDV